MRSHQDYTPDYHFTAFQPGPHDISNPHRTLNLTLSLNRLAHSPDSPLIIDLGCTVLSIYLLTIQSDIDLFRHDIYKYVPSYEVKKTSHEWELKFKDWNLAEWEGREWDPAVCDLGNRMVLLKSDKGPAMPELSKEVDREEENDAVPSTGAVATRRAIPRSPAFATLERVYGLYERVADKLLLLVALMIFMTWVLGHGTWVWL